MYYKQQHKPLFHLTVWPHHSVFPSASKKHPKLLLNIACTCKIVLSTMFLSKTMQDFQTWCSLRTLVSSQSVSVC